MNHIISNNINNVLYTIGHSKLQLEDFLSLIEVHNINCIVDVRSTPYSQYTSQFNKENLSSFLKKHNVNYLHMGKEFGARRDDKSLYDSDGNLSFEKASASIPFSEGIERIKVGIEKSFKVAFMCTEKDPFDCHRAIMIGCKLHNLGFDIRHILHDGSIQSQDELELKLLDKYFPNRNQLSLFENMNDDEHELIKEAYQMRNRDIAYNIEEEN